MKEMIITEFGKIQNGTDTKLFTLTNHAGMSISVTNYGAALVKVVVPDLAKKPVDVVLGYDDAAGYEKGDAAIGATVGRYANRIGTGSFTLGNQVYTLTKNDGENALHGGRDFYNKRIWDVRNKSNQKITFTLHSVDGDQGFPGTIDFEVTYELTEDNEVKINYNGSPNKDTLINLTNHSYFNLNGQGSGTIINHIVSIDADSFTRNDAYSIPTGEILPVKDTPMDFRKKKVVAEDIDADYEATQLGHGFDHNWILNRPGSLRQVATATGEKTKITMEVYTDLPGVQFYTANFLNDEHGKDGNVYQRRDALCFETQYFPDAIHHDNFIQPICKAGEIYNTTTMYKFIAG